MVAHRLYPRSSKLLLGCLSVATCFWGPPWMSRFYGSALANSNEPVLLDMPIYDRTSSDDLTRRAESMVSQEINQHFSSDPSLTEIKIVVLGNRNGDVIPILITTVSRTQWQENPQVSAWTQYNGTAYALIQRHDGPQPTQVATSPSRRSTTVASRGIATQFDRQFDSGRLSGQTMQSYADLVD